MNLDPPKKQQSNQNDLEHTDPADLPFDEFYIADDSSR
jgi:hypothetical protein